MSRSITFAIVFAIALFLVACTTTQQQVTEQPVKIGVLASTSGSAAIFGEAFIKGVNRAAEEINANGTRVKLVYEDNKNDPREGVQAYQRLRLDNPDIVLSSMSGATVAIAPLVKEDGKPLIGTLSIAQFNKDYDNSYRYFFGSPDVGAALVAFLNERGMTRVGIYATNSEAGMTIVKAVREHLAAANITVVAQETHDPTITDHKTALLKIAAQEPQLIYVWAIRPDQVVGDAKAAYNGPIIFNEVVGISRFYLTNDNFDGTYAMVLPFAVPGTEQNKKFNEMFGEQQSGYTAFGYDIVYAIVDALDHGATPDTLAQMLSERGYSGLVDAKQVTGERETAVPMRVLRVENRTLVQP